MTPKYAQPLKADPAYRAAIAAAAGLTIPCAPPDGSPMERVPKNVGGIRAKAGRRAPACPAHYMTDAECRKLNREIEANLQAKANPGHKPEDCPMKRPRRKGLQNLCFRNFQTADHYKGVDWSLSNREIARQLDVTVTAVLKARKVRGIAPSHHKGWPAAATDSHTEVFHKRRPAKEPPPPR